MANEIKPQKRQYDSTRRQREARERRRQILEAARRLFLERGYTGTTIESIATEGAVAVETVYAAFRNKRTILARLFDVSVVGDDEPVPLLEREGPQAVRQERDQRRQIELFARGIREIMGRVGPLFEILRLAASTEPELRTLLEDLLEKRLVGMRFFVEALAANGPLRGAMEVSEAVDAVWTLTSTEVHRLLTVERGWSEDRYEAWLAGTLTVVLLPGE